MTCDYCTEAEANPQSPKYRGQCLGCQARMLSIRPEHATARDSLTITPEYRAALQSVFGADWKAGHEQVKAWTDKRARK